MRYDARTRRLKLRQQLSDNNGVPNIDKMMLRGGLRNINLRKEIIRYKKEVKKFKDEEISKKPKLKDIRFINWEGI